MPFRGTLAGLRDGPMKTLPRATEQCQPWIQAGQCLHWKQPWRRTWGYLWMKSCQCEPSQPPISWAESKAVMAAGEGRDFTSRIFILSSEWLRNLSSNNSNKLGVIWVLPKYFLSTWHYFLMSPKANPGFVSTEPPIWVGTYRQPRQARKSIWSRNATTPSSAIAAIQARQAPRSRLPRVTLWKGKEREWPMGSISLLAILLSPESWYCPSKWQHKPEELHNSQPSSVYGRVQQNKLQPALLILPGG